MLWGSREDSDPSRVSLTGREVEEARGLIAVLVELLTLLIRDMLTKVAVSLSLTPVRVISWLAHLDLRYPPQRYRRRQSS